MISLILPVYNVGKYLKECLDSILNQTYRDYQLIIVDDGSTDNSMDIINNYESKFKNITIIKQKNKGVSEARNTAMNYVEGEYTLFIDSDDFLDKHMLEILLERAQEFDADVTICEYYFYYGENECKKNKIQLYNVDETRIYKSYEVMNFMLEDKLQGQLWHKFFKTELLKSLQIEFAPGRYIQDIFPVFKAISKCEKIAFVKKPLYYYRQIETSTVHKKNMKIADDFFFATKSIMDFIKKDNIEIDINSYKKFCCITLNKFIGYYLTADSRNDEKTFKNSRYSSLYIPFFSIFLERNINLKIKIKIMLWNISIYSRLRKFKKVFKK